ncbi:hypothetical protein DNU06_03995 [Putridiphycobacter roseus]|uniref:histidine kinase n=1 Tax=Putridiphycobacter roseus TaxID=2219161 RepID=A0A2W1MZX6_9FLAO|nr:ATP-binding protein [Putridiphycobacter roseus]PZE17789.1 hypothetical protein DNU06_03995 [Putridiphycobacter roseus]
MKKVKLSALIIEEREEDYLLLKNCMSALTEWQVETQWAKTYEEGVEHFKSLNIDVCFLDTHLGNETGSDFLNELSRLKEHIPIILVGTKNQVDELIEDDGVDDFVNRNTISPAVISKSIKFATETYKQQELLRVEKEKYVNLFSNSHEAIFTADKNFKVIRYNESFKNLMQLENIQSFDFRKMIISDDIEMLFKSISKKTGKNIQRAKIKNGVGKILEVYISISTILYSKDEANFQGVIHDITELEIAEAENIRTEKLELMSRMARILGHEVRNPLSNIMLATEEMKLEFGESEDAKMLLNLVHRNTKRISTLIDNFLKNTRNSKIAKQDIFIENALKNAINNCKDRITLKKIDFINEGLAQESKIYGDKEQLTIAFTNIIINAIEALDQTENPKIIIALNSTSTEVEVGISDNGIGMSPEVQENLFTPFYSSKQGGLGLGMANTKNIFDVHKAKVSVDSTSNAGTRFKIVFKLNQ